MRYGCLVLGFFCKLVGTVSYAENGKKIDAFFFFSFLFSSSFSSFLRRKKKRK